MMNLEQMTNAMARIHAALGAAACSEANPLGVGVYYHRGEGRDFWRLADNWRSVWCDTEDEAVEAARTWSEQS